MGYSHSLQFNGNALKIAKTNWVLADEIDDLVQRQFMHMLSQIIVHSPTHGALNLVSLFHTRRDDYFHEYGTYMDALGNETPTLWMGLRTLSSPGGLIPQFIKTNRKHYDPAVVFAMTVYEYLWLATFSTDAKGWTSKDVLSREYLEEELSYLTVADVDMIRTAYIDTLENFTPDVLKMKARIHAEIGTLPSTSAMFPPVTAEPLADEFVPNTTTIKSNPHLIWKMGDGKKPIMAKTMYGHAVKSSGHTSAPTPYGASIWKMRGDELLEDKEEETYPDTDLVTKIWELSIFWPVSVHDLIHISWQIKQGETFSPADGMYKWQPGWAITKL